MAPCYHEDRERPGRCIARQHSALASAGPLARSGHVKAVHRGRVASRRLREALAVIEAVERRRDAGRLARALPAPDARARAGSRDRRGDRGARSRRAPARVVTGARRAPSAAARIRARAARAAHMAAKRGRTATVPRVRAEVRALTRRVASPTIATGGGARRAHRPPRRAVLAARPRPARSTRPIACTGCASRSRSSATRSSSLPPDAGAPGRRRPSIAQACAAAVRITSTTCRCWRCRFRRSTAAGPASARSRDRVRELVEALERECREIHAQRSPSCRNRGRRRVIGASSACGGRAVCRWRRRDWRRPKAAGPRLRLRARAKRVRRVARP